MWPVVAGLRPAATGYAVVAARGGLAAAGRDWLWLAEDVLMAGPGRPLLAALAWLRPDLAGLRLAPHRVLAAAGRNWL